MKVKELIKKLQEFPSDMLIGIDGMVEYDIIVSKKTWEDTNYPWNRESFEYINIE